MGGEEAVFATELTMIKESEARADELQKQAKADAKEALRKAEEKADQIVMDAENRAKTMYDSLLAEGETLAQKQYDLFLKEAKGQCEAMVNKAKANQNRAIDLIVERIVSASVNC